MRWRGRKALFVVAGFLLLGGISFGASQVFDVDRELYPYYPSLFKWNKSTVQFSAPEDCGACHTRQFEEWSGSVHALAFQDPIYQGELNRAAKAIGHDGTRLCEGCHSPAGMVTGEIKKPGISGLSAVALGGVSCDICHSVSATTHWQTPSHEPENGSLVLTPGVDTATGPKAIKRGPFKPADGCGGGAHECAQSPLHLRADLCAGCHQVFHYEDHFPLESTYAEWKHGAYAQKEILCQDCHMVDLAAFKKAADEFRKPQRDEYRHFFNGANYLLYYLAAGAAQKGGDPKKAAMLKEKYEMAVKRLQAAAELEIFPVYRKGGLAEVKVRVKNVRAGHNLPTSLTNVREMWLEVTARDETGKVLMSSGTLDAKGHLAGDTRKFNSEGMGKDFHFAVDPWVVTSFSRHDTIPPRGYKEVVYGITAPPKAAKITFEARLRYRQADQGIAEALLASVPAGINLKEIYGLEKVPSLPVVDMQVKKVSLNARKQG